MITIENLRIELLSVAIFLFSTSLLAIEDNVDLSFHAARLSKTNGFVSVESTVTQSNGKILIGGDFTNVDDLARGWCVRLNASGTLDVNFDASPNSIVNTIAIQPNGKILIGGEFTSVGGVDRTYIARLHNDGTVDNNFNPNLNDTVKTIVLQEDGKILIGGNFSTIDGQTRALFARLNANGTLDTSFNAGLPVAGFGRSIVLQEDGKILLGGFFLDDQGNHLSRMNSAGGVDIEFNANFFFTDQIKSMALQDDGKIVVSGNITMVNQGVKKLARLDIDGSFDSDFTSDISGGSVESLLVQADDKILIGGTFDKVDGVDRSFLARLDSNGAHDASFAPEILGQEVLDIKMQDDNKIIIAGEFSRVNGSRRSQVARLGRNINREESEELCLPIKSYSGGIVVICL